MMHRAVNVGAVFQSPTVRCQDADEAATIWQRIVKIRLDSDPGLAYYYFAASRPKKHFPLFIAVHGIGRRAIDQARWFAPIIEAVGGVLMAPMFQRQRFSDYQRLGRSGKGERPDLALQRMVAHQQRIDGRPHHQMVMFGYSGGGQFVHRYAMAYPRQVKRMAVAAAGWFTFPDVGITFPHGLKPTVKLPDLKFDAARFLKIPALVLVGEDDTLRDRALNQRDRIDQRQGHHRLERAQRWAAAMSAAATRYHYDTQYQIDTLQSCGHSFVDCMRHGRMGRRIMGFLFDDNLRPGGCTSQDAIRSLEMVNIGGDR